MAKQYSPEAVEKSYDACITLVNAYTRAFVTHCKKYVNKLIVFYFPFYHADGIPGGKHLSILKQM